MERRSKQSIQFSCRQKRGSQCLETKTWILHFTIFLIHQSVWIFWRWNKFQRLWLHGTLDIEEYVNIILPYTEEKWRGKVSSTSEGPLAPLKGGANPWYHKLRKDEEQLLVNFSEESVLWGIKTLLWDKGGEKTTTQRKMPFGGLAGLKEQVLKPGKEEVKNTVGDSLGKLQRWEGLYGEWWVIAMKTVCRVFHPQSTFF